MGRLELDGRKEGGANAAAKEKRRGTARRSPPRYSTMAGSLRHIYRAEGLFGLWRGSFARVVFTAPNTAITMLVYEQVKKRVDDY